MLFREWVTKAEGSFISWESKGPTWGTVSQQNDFENFRENAKILMVRGRAGHTRTPYKCVRRGNVREVEIRPGSDVAIDETAVPPMSIDETDETAVPPMSIDETDETALPPMSIDETDEAALPPMSIEETDEEPTVPVNAPKPTVPVDAPTTDTSTPTTPPVQCAPGMLTSTNSNIPSSNVRTAAASAGQDKVDRYVQECQCLESKGELTSVACDATDAQWKETAGVPSSSSSPSEISNFANFPIPVKAAVMHLRVERGGQLKVSQWPSLLGALGRNDFAAASRELFTKKSLMKAGCQRWKWVKDASACTSMRFSTVPAVADPNFRGSAKINDGGALLTQN